MEHLKGLGQLQTLSLNDTGVTDVGLKYLKGLRHLERLSLDNTQVTDAGLEHIKGMGQLQLLFLDGTHVTVSVVSPKFYIAPPACTALGSPDGG